MILLNALMKSLIAEEEVRLGIQVVLLDILVHFVRLVIFPLSFGGKVTHIIPSTLALDAHFISIM